MLGLIDSDGLEEIDEEKVLREKIQMEEQEEDFLAIEGERIIEEVVMKQEEQVVEEVVDGDDVLDDFMKEIGGKFDFFFVENFQ